MPHIVSRANARKSPALVILASMVSLVSMISMTGLVACQPGRTPSNNLRIIGGQDTDQESLTWAVRMRIDGGSLCTGSFVGPNTLLTASHCVRAGSKVFVKRYETTSIKVIEHPESTDEVEPNDLAIVMFADNTATKWTRLSAQPPKRGDEVQMIGYGSCTTWDGADTGTRRCMGKNKISSFSDDDMIRTARSAGVAVSPGDSGGPMFNGDETIVGVASGGYAGSSSLHVNVFLPANVKFLQDTVRRHGAIICGLEGFNHPACNTQAPGASDDEPVRIPDPVSD
jgi:V8-like Glu-specific endopeptidase